MGLAQGFTDSFKADGRGPSSAEVNYSEGDFDFHSQLTSIQGMNPDVLVVPGYYRQAELIIQQARQLDLEVPVHGGRRVGLADAYLAR